MRLNLKCSYLYLHRIQILFAFCWVSMKIILLWWLRRIQKNSENFGWKRLHQRNWSTNESDGRETISSESYHNYHTIGHDFKKASIEEVKEIARNKICQIATQDIDNPELSNRFVNMSIESETQNNKEIDFEGGRHYHLFKDLQEAEELKRTMGRLFSNKYFHKVSLLLASYPDFYQKNNKESKNFKNLVLQITT